MVSGTAHDPKETKMPLELRRWICDWLQERSMFISHGEARSRTFRVCVGAPQGSVLAALLFRLHIHFLPSYLAQATTHLYADDLTMIFPGTIERRFSDNVVFEMCMHNENSQFLEFLESLISCTSCTSCNS